MRVVLLGATSQSQGLLHQFTSRSGFDTSTPEIDTLTVIASTLRDTTVHGLRFSPDIDALTMPPTDPVEGGAVDELSAYQVDAQWFPMTERTLAAAILRTRLLNLGYTIAQAVEAMAKRFNPLFTILPLSNQAVEAFAIVEGTAWPVHRWFAENRPPSDGFVLSGIDRAQAAPGVLAAIRGADIVMVADDTEPDLGFRGVLALPGIRDALEGTRARVLAVTEDHLGEGGGDDLKRELSTITFVSDAAEAMALGPVDRAVSATTIWDQS